MPAPASSQRATWRDARPAPLVLVSGGEDVLAGRAVSAIVAAVKERDPELDVHRIDASAYGAGQLRGAASPSLFGGAAVVIVESAEAMNDAFLADALAYVAAPESDAVVVIRHGGGNRGKRLLDAMRAAAVPEYSCAAVTKDAELVDFVTAEFRTAKVRATTGAVRALVDAVGTDVAQLAAACAQLGSDVGGAVDEAAVQRYFGTRVNATGFAVADAAIAGEGVRALALVRHALESGVDPVPLVAALASKLRLLAKVGASRGRGVDPTRDLGIAPWQADRARKELRRWDGERLGAAIEAVAAADHEVKGAGRAPAFAVERAVRRIAELAQG